MATSRSVVGHMSGIEACRKLPYRAVTSRESSTATTPRSLSRRISRPEPWASSRAAWVAATAMNPLPPASATARCRAKVSGSSGRGNGIRSMITSWQVAPGTSMPCHSERVPNRLACSSAMNRRVSSGSWASPWHSTFSLGSSRADVDRGGLGRPARAEQPQRAPTGRPDQLGDLGQRRLGQPVPARRRQGPGDVADALLPVRERRPHVQAAPRHGRVLAPVLLAIQVVDRMPVRLVVPFGRPQADAGGQRGELPAELQGRRGEHDGLGPEDRRSHQPGHRQRRDPDLPAQPFPVGDPDHVVLGQAGHPLGDVEDLPDRRRGLPPLGVALVLAAAQGADRRPGRVADGHAARDHGPVRVLDPGQRRPVQRPPQRVGRLEQRQGVLVVQVGQRPPGHPLDQRRSELGRRRPGHPADQLVGLVDHHRGVLGQRRAAVHGVDGQQRVVGHHQVRGPSGVPGRLHQAGVAVRAALRGQALADRDRDLLPGALGVRRGVVAVGQAAGPGLLLGPLPQRQHLRAQDRLRGWPAAQP